MAACNRCDGVGLVIAFDGRPLFLSPSRAVEKLFKYRNNPSTLFIDAMLYPGASRHMSRLSAAVADNNRWRSHKCPDCSDEVILTQLFNSPSCTAEGGVEAEIVD